MSLSVKEKEGFKYVDEGQGPVLMLLHGLFGALSNWEEVVNHYSKHHRVVIPMLPIYEMPIKEAGLVGLREFTEKFVETMQLDNMIIMGNSLGGHVGILYTLNNPSKVTKLVLTGSSGLFESAMGGSYPRRGSYDYVRERVAYTFYDPNVASKELVDEVFETVMDFMAGLSPTVLVTPRLTMPIELDIGARSVAFRVLLVSVTN